ncbi:hypothetical protein EON66_05120 [archaeon]|nr:MAG: hypothetical protein EON66_05120 [archaeon]
MAARVRTVQPATPTAPVFTTPAIPALRTSTVWEGHAATSHRMNLGGTESPTWPDASTELAAHVPRRYATAELRPGGEFIVVGCLSLRCILDSRHPLTSAPPAVATAAGVKRWGGLNRTACTRAARMHALVHVG